MWNDSLFVPCFIMAKFNILDTIHAHQIKAMIFQGRFLEDELTLQFHLLKVGAPDPYLLLYTSGGPGQP
jgi:hypothetical protein